MTQEDKEYFSHPYVNNSGLSKFKGGDHWANKQKAFAFGSLVHAAILQFDRLNIIRATLDGEAIDPIDVKRGMNMRRAFFDNDKCRDLFKTCRTEVAMYNKNTRFEFHGTKFAIDTKRKYDLWNDVGTFGGDIKTTNAETHEQFLNAIDEYDYDRGRVFYAAGSGAKMDIIIGISKINFNIFLVPMNKGCKLWTRGEEKLAELAYRYWHKYPPF